MLEVKTYEFQIYFVYFCSDRIFTKSDTCTFATEWGAYFAQFEFEFLV